MHMKWTSLYIGAVIMACFVVMSCDNDKGNYDYDTLNTGFVEETSLPESIVIKQNDFVRVEPRYKAGNPNSSLDYQWRLITTKPVEDPVTGKFYDVIVGKDKNLAYKVTETPGDYLLILTVKDQANGDITQMVKVPFTVSSYASVGWMLMHTAQDSSDISILVNPLVNPVVSSTTDFVQADVFSETNGHKLFGEGKGINYVGNHWVDIYTHTDEGGVRASGNDLRVLNSYSDMFIERMPRSEIAFDAYGSWSYNQLLVNSGALYFISQANGSVYSKYGIRCFGQDYIAAPYIGTLFNWAYYGVIYDQKNRRFLYIDYAKDVKLFKAAGATAAFDMSNVGLDMVYAEHGMDSKWFCVMQQPGDINSRQLLACRFNVMDDGNRGVGKYNLSAATEFAQARYFAFGHKANVMYYATDTKLYQNNYEGDRSSVLRLDVGVQYPGYKISNMRIFKVANHISDGKILYVALYNESTKQGILLQCQVNEVSGVINNVKAYTGFGKIGAMGYKAK